VARKIDKRKLEAMARDPGAAPAERALAQKLLDVMNAVGGDREGVLVGARESWEIALVEMLVEKYGLVVSEGRGGFVQVEGDASRLDVFVDSLVHLQPKLEAVVMSATAGFLSAHFPPTGPATDEPEDPIQAAARRSATSRKEEGPKQIGTQTVRQIEQREETREPARPQKRRGFRSR
jgi:hypothetical protein